MFAKAKDIQTRALTALSKPAALMLPKDIRDLIVDLVALVVELTKKGEVDGENQDR